MEFKDAIRQFERGAVFQVMDETGIFLAGQAENPSTWEIALAYLNHFENYFGIDLDPSPQILLDTTETLLDVLNDVPDIVYEIIPYAEKPLELRMNHVKARFQHLTDAKEKVGLRYVRNTKFADYMVATSGCWFGCYLQNALLPRVESLHFPLNREVFSLNSDATLPHLNFKKGRQIQFKKFKRLSLELDGSFKFLE